MAIPVREAVEQLRQLWQPPQAGAGEDVIEVSSATRKIAGAYERFRNTLEPEEEDILRRSAIARILERRLKQNRSTNLVAVALIQELIRANYIHAPSRQIVIPVAQDIDRARFIQARLEPSYHDWFVSLVAVSLDRRLHLHSRQTQLVELMYHDSYQRASWFGDLVEEEQRPSQLYIACYRVLFAADDAEVIYTYFMKQFPAWENPSATEADLTHLAVHLPAFYATARHLVEHPARHRLMRLLRPVSAPYRILSDVLHHPAGEVWESEAALDNAVRQAVADRSASIRRRMRRRTWHSILFLFLTKTILTGLLEYPYELFILRQVHWGALGINILFHPALLFVTSAFTRMPPSTNTERITDQVRRIVTGEGELPTLVLSPTRHFGPLTWSGFAVLYTLLFLGIFWSLFTLLDLLDFSLVAMFLFIIFLGLVMFLSFRVRRAVDDLRLEPEREGFIATLFSFIGLPVLEFGRWLARNIQQLNVFLFFMDRVLEAPFKLLIDIIEDWFAFVRDRKEEIV